jgi:hypothetical protein
MMHTSGIAALVSVALCACGDYDAVGHVDWTAAAPSADAASSGSGREPDDVECPILPAALRVIRADDSRGVEANTIVLAAAEHDQSFWLPRATEHAGAVVVVADVIGGNRRVSVYAAGGDEFHDGSVEHQSFTPWSARAFMAVVGDDGEPRWRLTEEGM